jgi:CBS domain-containing protein
MEPRSGPDALCGPNEIPVSAIMTTNVIAVREDLTLDALARMFLDHRISGAPVVDSGDRVVGVVSKTDLVVVPEEERFAPRVTVADIMMPLAFSLGEHATLAQASALMVVEGVHRVPIVSDDGCLIGILSTLDVLRWLAERSGYRV